MVALLLLPAVVGFGLPALRSGVSGWLVLACVLATVVGLVAYARHRGAAHVPTTVGTALETYQDFLLGRPVRPSPVEPTGDTVALVDDRPERDPGDLTDLAGR